MNVYRARFFLVLMLALPTALAIGGDDADVASLIKQLGSDEFNQREAATNALIEVGSSALADLQNAAASNQDLEVRLRSDGIIKAIAVELAGYKPNVAIRASGVFEDKVPGRAFDGDPSTTWNSGGPPPNWIEADVGALRKVISVALLPDHSDLRTGETVHEIWVSRQPIENDRTEATLVHTFKQAAVDSRELKFRLPDNQLARYIQIRTTQSPSWVAWREMELRVR